MRSGITRRKAEHISPSAGPFIQRKRDGGFGEGNFTALFKSTEGGQLRRGALKVVERVED